MSMVYCVHWLDYDLNHYKVQLPIQRRDEYDHTVKEIQKYKNVVIENNFDWTTTLLYGLMFQC